VGSLRKLYIRLLGVKLVEGREIPAVVASLEVDARGQPPTPTNGPPLKFPPSHYHNLLFFFFFPEKQVQSKLLSSKYDGYFNLVLSLFILVIYKSSYEG